MPEGKRAGLEWPQSSRSAAHALDSSSSSFRLPDFEEKDENEDEEES